MALSLTYVGNSIVPVYSTINWTITDTSVRDYFEIDVYPEGFTKRTLRLLQGDTATTFNVAGILQDCFNSDANQTVDSSIISYSIVGKAFISSVETSILYSTKATRVFNGADNNNFDVSLYIISDSPTAKFLNNFSADHDIHYDAIDTSTRLTLEAFSGTLGLIKDPSIYNLLVTKYNVSGDADAFTFALGYNSTAAIKKIDISPKTLNIPYTCKYYTVRANTTKSELVRVNLVSRDTRFDKYFRIIWIDRHGCTNAFNFNLAYLNSIDVEKQTFNSSGTYKAFGTIVSDKMTVTSNWIDEKQSEAISSLWYSPSVKVQTPPLDYTFKDIILDVKKMEILKRRNSKLINYTFSFAYAKEFLTQRQ